MVRRRPWHWNAWDMDSYVASPHAATGSVAMVYHIRIYKNDVYNVVCKTLWPYET